MRRVDRVKTPVTRVQRGAMFRSLLEAIEAAGTQTELARRLGPPMKQNRIHEWIRRSKRVPLEWCPAVEMAVDGQVVCEVMRPDVQWNRDAEGRIVGYSVPFDASGRMAR